MKTILLAGKKIERGARPFVIAEAGVNHNGDLRLARKLVDAAAGAGADAVKFQTFKAESVVTPFAPKARYQKISGKSGESQLDMIKRLELPFEAFGLLKKHCERRGILFLSTPFDDESADYLDSIGMPAFKIPSGEITNIPFLSHIAAKGKPVILSTGMSTLAEVAAAVRALRAAGARRLVLLHCVSNYPAAPADVNLRAMAALVKAFRVPVGYSDHTLGIEVSIAAAALGACVIEKHFTLDRRLKGPDHAASLEPDELAALVRGVRTAHDALGDGRKRPAASEREVAAVARRSIVAARAIPAGAALSTGDLAIKRPGTGLPPAMRDRLLGRRVRRSIPAGTALKLGMLA